MPERPRSPLPYYKNKTVEFIRLIHPVARQAAMMKAGYNTFHLKSRDVFIDLLTDSGTSAMSDKQWSGIMLGDEAYAGSESFYKMEHAVRRYFGFACVIPTHQGRGAEHIMAKVLIKNGGFIPNNLYFTTSRAHQELAGGTWVDVSIPQAKDPESQHPFKGNIDLKKLSAFIAEKGSANIPFVRIEASVNMAGGQPFSFENLMAVSKMCRDAGIFLLLDATRIVENAYFIRKREQGYGVWNIRDLVWEMCLHTDGCTMSSKKDHFVNIGGFLATRQKKVFNAAKELVVMFEGLHTYGGMAGRDMEALAVGIAESVENESLVEHYVGQVAYLGRMLMQRGIPVVQPLGAHAVFLDAKKFFPQIPQDQFPAQTLAAHIYLEGGVRTMERGIVSGQHGKTPYNDLELVRLTIPRRVYETAHLDYVADTVERVWKRRKRVRGLKMVYEPANLRFFQARFESLD